MALPWETTITALQEDYMSPTCGFRPRHEICCGQWIVSRNVCHFWVEAVRVRNHFTVLSVLSTITPALFQIGAVLSIQVPEWRWQAEDGQKHKWQITFCCHKSLRLWVCFLIQQNLTYPLCYTCKIAKSLSICKRLGLRDYKLQFWNCSDRYVLKYVFYTNEAFTQKAFYLSSH